MRFEVPAQKKPTHEMVIPIRWGDMDAMGHEFIAGATFDEYPNSSVDPGHRMNWRIR